MNRIFLFVLCSFFALAMTAKDVTPASSLPDYYEDIHGKAGKSLFDAVHVVAKKGYSSLGYSGLWTAYRTTDLRDNGKVWDMYSDCSWTYGSNQCGIIMMSAIVITASTLSLNHGLEVLKVNLDVIFFILFLPMVM